MSGTLPDDCEVLVIGGGLTGLTCAVLLHDAGHSVIVVEAAERLGGRVCKLLLLSLVPLRFRAGTGVAVLRLR